jgi:hypothetical protein
MINTDQSSKSLAETGKETFASGGTLSFVEAPV